MMLTDLYILARNGRQRRKIQTGSHFVTNIHSFGLDWMQAEQFQTKN